MNITDWIMLIFVAGFFVGLVVFGFFGPEVMRPILHFLETGKKKIVTEIK